MAPWSAGEQDHLRTNWGRDSDLEEAPKTEGAPTAGQGWEPEASHREKGQPTQGEGGAGTGDRVGMYRACRFQRAQQKAPGVGGMVRWGQKRGCCMGIRVCE